MSELQLGLAIVGALVIVGVLVFNRTQERAAQRRADASFRSQHADALMGDTRAADGAGARPHAARAAGTDDVPDANLDYIIHLAADAPVSAAAMRELWTSPSRRIRERSLIAASPDAASWLPMNPGDAAAYRHFRAALQLVSRNGVIGEADLIEFRSEVETMAARLGMKVESPEMKASLEAAHALDAFCAERDIQVALHVVSQSAQGFDRRTVLELGERFGMTLNARGGLSCRDAAGRLLYEAMDRGSARLDATGPEGPAVRALSLTMDVPRVPDTGRSFEAMSRLAASLAAEAGGTLVDDNDIALDDRALASIGAQLEGIRAELDARGIAPGSAPALRLFS